MADEAKVAGCEGGAIATDEQNSLPTGRQAAISTIWKSGYVYSFSISSARKRYKHFMCIISMNTKMLPVVFVHGFGGGPHDYQPIIRFLKNNGYDYIYEFKYTKVFGTVSLGDIAQELSTYIKNNVHEKEFVFITISQGGIIARYYLHYFCSNNVPICITLCTPHQGSMLAYLCNFPGCRELRPGSTFLKELNQIDAHNHLTSYYAVYNPCDLMVFPGWNAKFCYAKENLRVLAPLHQFAFWRKKTLQFILSALQRVKKTDSL